MTKERKILLNDVAKAVGVSKTLVSIVINGKAKQYRISEKMEKRVFEVVNEMNYSPNLVAQNLRGGKSQLIGVIVTDISNPFYSMISRIIEDKANELSYTVLFSSSDENLVNTKKLIKVLINKGVDGLIIVPCDGSEEIIKNLQEDNIPLVLLDRYFPNLEISFSCLDNKKATALATQHLIDRGYKKIAVVSYLTDMNHMSDRVAGYENTMIKSGKEKNINIKRINISNQRMEMYGALDYLLKEGTDAIICLTNMLSINGIYCLNEMKVKIPEDIAFVGFNRSDVFNLLHSPITYIKQPIEQIANEAINILIEKINHPGNLKKSISIGDPELVIQHSTPQKSLW